MDRSVAAAWAAFSTDSNNLARHLARGTVDAGTGDVAAPVLGVRACVVEAGERLAVEPVFRARRVLVFDAGLVFGRPYTAASTKMPRLVRNRETLPPTSRQRVGILDHRLRVDLVQDLIMAPKNFPRAQSLADSPPSFARTSAQTNW